MSFLSPLFLLGLLALAVPLALHLIRRRVVRSVPFPALRFLAPTRADERQHRIRRRLVLALRCLALAALAAAFARPFLGALPPASGRATVVLIDNSFSLQTSDRWPALLRQTRSALGSPTAGDSLGLLLMNPRPTWLLAPTHDTSAALAALDTLRPGWHATRAEPALRLAAEVLAATPARERRILFLGDHQALGWAGTDFAQTLPAGISVVFPEPSPPPSHQAAVLALSLTREPEHWVATLTARNFSPAHSRTVSLFAEDSAAPLLSAPLSFGADQTLSTRLLLPGPADAPPPAYIRATLDPDELPAGDTIWALAPAEHTRRLLYLDAPPAGPGPAADHLGTAFAALAALPPALRVQPPPALPWPLPGAAVLRSDRSFAGPAGERLDAFLRAGGAALIFLDDGPAQRAWLARHQLAPTPLSPPSPRAPAGRLRDWALDHPLIEPLAATHLRSLVGWEFARAWSLPADRVEPLASWSDGSVALGEFTVGSGRVLVAGFHPARRDSDWPLQAAFVPFLHRAATYLLGLTAASTDGTLRVGDPTPAGSSPGTWRALAAPASESTVLHPSLATFPFPGIYEFTAPGSPRRLHAVGLEPAESDPAPWPEGRPWEQLVNAEPALEQTFDSRLAAASSETEQQNPLWWWAAAALAAFALAELSLANRTTR